VERAGGMEMSRQSKRAGMPSHKIIAAAWMDATPWASHVESDDAASTCWRCGYTGDDFKPERAHIHAVRNGGTNEPLNLLLLCYRCHKEQPDAAEREEQLAWLKAGENYLMRMMRDADLMAALEELATQARKLDMTDVHDLGDAMAKELREVGMRTSSGGTRAAMILHIRKRARELAEWL
jgi:hypothetical protein